MNVSQNKTVLWVGYIASPPYVIEKCLKLIVRCQKFNVYCYPGLSVDLFGQLFQDSPYIFAFRRYDSMGTVTNSTSTGIIGGILNDEIQLTLPQMEETPENIKIVNFLKPYPLSWTGSFLINPAPRHMIFPLFAPFQSDVWILGATAFLMATGLLAIYTRPIRILRVMQNAYALSFNQRLHGKWRAIGFHAMVLLSIWSICSLVTSLRYKSSFVRSAIPPSKSPPKNEFDEFDEITSLVTRRNYNVYFYKSSTIERQLLSGTQQKYESLKRAIQSQRQPPNDFTVKKISETPKSVLWTTNHMANSAERHYENLLAVDNQGESPVYLTMAYNISRISNHTNVILRRRSGVFSEMGVPYKLLRKYKLEEYRVPALQQLYELAVGNSDTLSLLRIGPLFQIPVGGYFIALVAFVLEQCASRR